MQSPEWSLVEVTSPGRAYWPRNPESAPAFLIAFHEKVQASIHHESSSLWLTAWSPICTHMGCVLAERDGAPESLPEGVLGPCPCHGTRFDLTRGGLVVLGPATQHLPQLTLELDGEVVRGTFPADQTPPEQERWGAPDVGNG